MGINFEADRSSIMVLFYCVRFGAVISSETLVRALGLRSLPTSISTRCSTVKPHNLQQMLLLDNLSVEELLQLTLRAHPTDWRYTASVMRKRADYVRQLHAEYVMDIEAEKANASET